MSNEGYRVRWLHGYWWLYLDGKPLRFATEAEVERALMKEVDRVEAFLT